MIEFYLPFPPTVNNYYVKTSRGVFISQKGRRYRAGVAESLLEQVGGSDRDSNYYDGRLHVEVVLAPPDKRKRDLDNYMKALLDAISITGLVWEDDSQIDQLAIFRSQILKPGGQVKVVVNLAGPLVPLDYHS